MRFSGRRRQAANPAPRKARPTAKSTGSGITRWSLHLRDIP